MSGLNWGNLVAYGKGEQVEAFLENEDIANIIFTHDDVVIVNALFASIAKFEKFPKLQLRALQMLQDCQVLSPKSIDNHTLISRFDVLLRCLTSWISKKEIVVSLFEFLAMVSDKPVVIERCCRLEDTELLQFIEKALQIHQNNSLVQRAGLQLFQSIVDNANTIQRDLIAGKVFKIVLDNLLLHSEDEKICFSSFSILATLAGFLEELLTPYTDQIINLTLSTVDRVKSTEVISKCFALLEKISKENETLYTIAGHVNALSVLARVNNVLTANFMPAAITNFEIFLRIVESPEVIKVVIENIPILSENEKQSDYIDKLVKEVGDGFEKFLSKIEEFGKVPEDAVRYWFILYHQIIEILKEIYSSLLLNEKSNKKPVIKKIPANNYISKNNANMSVVAVFDGVDPSQQKMINNQFQQPMAVEAVLADEFENPNQTENETENESESGKLENENVVEAVPKQVFQDLGMVHFKSDSSESNEIVIAVPTTEEKTETENKTENENENQSEFEKESKKEKIKNLKINISSDSNSISSDSNSEIEKIIKNTVSHSHTIEPPKPEIEKIESEINLFSYSASPAPENKMTKLNDEIEMKKGEIEKSKLASVSFLSLEDILKKKDSDVRITVIPEKGESPENDINPVQATDDKENSKKSKKVRIEETEQKTENETENPHKTEKLKIDGKMKKTGSKLKNERKVEKPENNIGSPSVIKFLQNNLKNQKTKTQPKLNKQPSLQSIKTQNKSKSPNSPLEDLQYRDQVVLELVQSTQRAQQQATDAIRRADAMHSLFLEAVQKMEVLVAENDRLYAKLRKAEKIGEQLLSVGESPGNSDDEGENHQQENDIDDDEKDDDDDDDEDRVISFSQQGTPVDEDFFTPHPAAPDSPPPPPPPLDLAVTMEQEGNINTQSLSGKEGNTQVYDPDSFIPTRKFGSSFRKPKQMSKTSSFHSETQKTIKTNESPTKERRRVLLKENQESLAIAGFLEAFEFFYFRKGFIDANLGFYEKPEESENDTEKQSEIKSDDYASLFQDTQMEKVKEISYSFYSLFSILQREHLKKDITPSYPKEITPTNSRTHGVFQADVREKGQRKKQNLSLPVRLVRSCVRKTGWLDEPSPLSPGQLDILLRQLGVNNLSVFGFSFAMVLCCLHRFPESNVVEVLNHLNESAVRLLENLQNERQISSLANPLLPQPLLSSNDRQKIRKILFTEKIALERIFVSYSVRVSQDDGNISLGEMGFQHLLQFAGDFQLNPEIVDRNQITELFHLAASQPCTSLSQNVDDLLYTPQAQSANGSTFDQTDLTLSFDQFLEFLVMVALRSPLLRRHGQDVLRHGQGDDRNGQIAVDCLSGFLLLLAHSSGRKKLATKSRNSNIVKFRINSNNSSPQFTNVLTTTKNNKEQFSRKNEIHSMSTEQLLQLFNNEQLIGNGSKKTSFSFKNEISPNQGTTRKKRLSELKTLLSG